MAGRLVDRITEDDFKLIWKYLNGHMRQRLIAEKFGISEGTVSRIHCKNLTWEQISTGYTPPLEPEPEPEVQGELMSVEEAFALPPPEDSPLNSLAQHVHEIAAIHGFWKVGGYNYGEKIALIHSELSESLEEDRKDTPNVYFLHDTSCPIYGAYRATFDQHSEGCTCIAKPEGRAVELGDALIRVLDLMCHLGVDIDWVVEVKSAYNETRPPKHGRKY